MKSQRPNASSLLPTKRPLLHFAFGCPVVIHLASEQVARKLSRGVGVLKYCHAKLPFYLE
jgi:hypothetical protein